MRPVALALVFLLAGGAASLSADPGIDLRFQDVEISSVFRVISRLAGKNILLGKEVRGKITLDLSDVDPMQAIHLVAAVNKHKVLVRNNIVIVGNPETIAFVRGAGNVKIIPLRYGDAAELAEKLNRLYKGKIEVVADERTNSLLITRGK